MTYQPNVIDTTLYYFTMSSDWESFEIKKVGFTADSLSIGLLFSYAFLSDPNYQILGVLTGQRVFTTEKYRSSDYTYTNNSDSTAGSLGVYVTYKVTDTNRLTVGGKLSAVEDQKSAIGFSGAWTFLF